MGAFRFLLAALVVLFHFGGLSWIVGRVAVFAFYCISGFLIFQVLDRVYLGERLGSARFLTNRLVRLAPLYLAYALVTAVMIRAGTAAFQAVDAAGVQVGAESARDLLRRTVTLAPVFTHDGWLPIVGFDPPLLPQGWSIGVEASFYLLAPLVVLSTRRRPAWMAAWAFGALILMVQAFHVSGVDFDRFQVNVYKNALASVGVFFLGGACYYVRRQWGALVGAGVAWTAVAGWLALLVFPQLSGGTFPLPSAGVFADRLWLTLSVTCLVLLSAPLRIASFDRWAGNLCYGVYLNHFLAAALVIVTGLGPDVGEAGTPQAGLVVLIVSTALAALTYAVIERPFDLLRSRVRGRTAPAGAVSARRLRPGVAVVAAIVLLLLGGPVGWAVGRLNGAGSGASLPVSGPFHIRWRDGVSATARQRIESEFGLVVNGPVERDPRQRTYEYRLPHPTKGRVKALITNPAVEDTARVDVNRYEIAQ